MSLLQAAQQARFPGIAGPSADVIQALVPLICPIECLDNGRARPFDEPWSFIWATPEVERSRFST